MLLGCSKQDITPEEPIELAGFAHRQGKADTVHSKIFLKVFTIRSQGKHFVSIIADIIWWDSSFVSKLKSELQKQFHLKSKEVVFHATHNHSAPQTSDRFSEKLGRLEVDFLTLLEKSVMAGVRESLSGLEKVYMEIGKGTSDIGIYRRKKVNGEILMAPNYEEPVDNDLTIIKFITEREEVKGVWIHYSCHPTTTDENSISAEFVGHCTELVERKLPGSSVAFLQGCCGDIRPALVKENRFYRGSLQDIVAQGEKLAEDVWEVFSEPSERVDVETIEIHTTHLNLLFEKIAMSTNIAKSLEDEWQKKVKNKNKNVLDIQYINLGDKVKFLCFNAEMVQEYGKQIKVADPLILPLAYSNGMLGYIPTEKQLDEGGYESVDSIYYFGFPGKLSSSTQKEIQLKIEEIIRRRPDGELD